MQSAWYYSDIQPAVAWLGFLVFCLKGNNMGIFPRFPFFWSRNLGLPQLEYQTEVMKNDTQIPVPKFSSCVSPVKSDISFNTETTYSLSWLFKCKRQTGLTMKIMMQEQKFLQVWKQPIYQTWTESLMMTFKWQNLTEALLWSLYQSYFIWRKKIRARL